MTPSEEIRNEAYHSVKLKPSERIVLDTISMLGVATFNQICNVTGMPLNIVTARVGSLRQKYLVEYAGYREGSKTTSGKKRSLWGVTDPEDRKLEIQVELHDLKILNNRLLTDLDKVTVNPGISDDTRHILAQKIAKISDRIDELNKL